MKMKKLLAAVAALTAILLLGTCSLEGDIPIFRWPDSGGTSSTAVTAVYLNKTSTRLTVGSMETLTATVSPSNATNKSVSWSSSNYNIATVSANGLVAGVSVGNATITVTTSDGNRTATCSVSVTSSGTVSISLVRIEGGTFTMGSPSNEPERFSDEGPQHQVTLSAFYMGKYQVTQAEYQSVMGTNPSYFKGSNLPVEQVSWYDAAEFCNRLSQSEGLTPAYTINGTNVTCNWNANGYRLPTEAEWEYACRAGTTTTFSTGNNITTSQANYDGNYPYNNNATGIYRGTTTPVGSFASNPWGLYDMHGNVWEWCWDWYGSYSSGAQNNPRGPVSGGDRVVRGGSWYNLGRVLRSAYRVIYYPSGGSDGIGFRLVRP
jgi:formylglycine-generating enzyme required for sulfatase activity